MRAGRPRSQIMFIAREPRFPHAPARGKVRAQPARREMGKPGFPTPPARGKVRAQPARREMGKPGFPILPPGGRVWEGATRAQGDGETGVPHPPTRWEGVGGRSPRAGGWGNQVSPYPRPREGVGGRSPSKNNLLFHPVVRGAAAWMAEKNLCKGLTKSVHRGMLHRETFLGAKYRER